MGRILATMIHKNFPTDAQRAMIRERLARKYFTDPKKAVSWVRNEIKISKSH